MNDDARKEYDSLDLYDKLILFKESLENEVPKYYYSDLSELRKYQKITLQIYFALEEL